MIPATAAAARAARGADRRPLVARSRLLSDGALARGSCPAAASPAGEPPRGTWASPRRQAFTTGSSSSSFRVSRSTNRSASCGSGTAGAAGRSLRLLSIKLFQLGPRPLKLPCSGIERRAALRGVKLLLGLLQLLGPMGAVHGSEDSTRRAPREPRQARRPFRGSRVPAPLRAPCPGPCGPPHRSLRRVPPAPSATAAARRSCAASSPWPPGRDAA